MFVLLPSAVPKPSCCLSRWQPVGIGPAADMLINWEMIEEESPHSIAMLIYKIILRKPSLYEGYYYICLIFNTIIYAANNCTTIFQQLL